MDVKILRWHEYQRRNSDIKRPFWFSFSNTFFEDSDMWNLSDSEKLAWIYILCQASRQKKDTPRINFDHASRSSNVQKKSIITSLEKLESLNIVAVSRPRAGREAGEPRPLQDKTEQNKTRQDKTYLSTGVDIFISKWNECCEGLPKVKKTNSSRNLLIKARLKEEPDLNYWQETFSKITRSDFCTGQNKTSWVATFDWVLKPDTHLKVNEGKYDNRINKSKISNNDHLRGLFKEGE